MFFSIILYDWYRIALQESQVVGFGKVVILDVEQVMGRQQSLDWDSILTQSYFAAKMNPSSGYSSYITGSEYLLQNSLHSFKVCESRISCTTIIFFVNVS